MSLTLFETVVKPYRSRSRDGSLADENDVVAFGNTLERLYYYHVFNNLFVCKPCMVGQ